MTFVGRERELAELEKGLRSVVDGHGRLFLIGGEPGIGKSRLIEELTIRARERGAHVLVGRCWEAGGAPAYWPWVQALRAYVRETEPGVLRAQLGAGAADLAQLLSELHDLFPDLPEPPSLEPEDARFRLFEAVASFLKSAADHGVLVVVLDDLHAADEPSLLLLRFVAREIVGAKLLMVSAYRNVDPAPADALASTIAELLREPVTRQVALTGLGEQDVAEYIELSSGISPPLRLAQAVHAETEGNPLFVAEVVRLLEAEGHLGDADAYLRIPPGVRAVIEQRLGRLSERCRGVLASASVVGREFALEVVAQLSQLSRQELLEVLDEALTERVVAELSGSPGRLVFGHVLIRDTLYDGLPSAQRMGLHRQAGEVLEAVYATDLDAHLAEIAHHFVAAAPAAAPDKASEYARRAGDRAASQLAYEEAARLYETALPFVTDEGDRCELLLALGDAQTASGEPAAGVASFLAAAEIARRLGSSELLARAALGCGGGFLWSRGGNDPRVVTLVRDALDAIGPGDSPSRARLLARYSSMLRGRLPRDQQDAMSREAVEIARRLDDPIALARALWSRLMFAWEPEKAVEDLALSEEIVRLSDAGADWEYGVETRLFRSHAHLVLGDIAATHADVEEAARLAADRQLPSIVWHITVHRVELALLEGRFADAEELLGRAFELAHRGERADALGSHATQSYALRRELGGVEQVKQNLVWLAADRPERALPRCLLAELDCTLGRHGRARNTLLDLVADSCRAIPRDLGWALSMATLAEVAAALEEKTAAAVLYEQLLPAVDLALIDPHEFSVGAAARPLGLLAATCGRFSEAEEHFEHALELNERLGARPWLAHTEHQYARMLLRRAAPGDEERAQELLRSALATCRELRMEPLEDKVSTVLSEEERTEASPNSTFADYTIEEEIGRGGMGVVYRALDRSLERPVALKLIAPELASDEGFRKRFLKESRLAASLDHPHVLPVFQAGEEDGQLYLAMRYVEGQDLKTLLRSERTLDPQRALRICGQVAEALDAAHRRGLVHRDLKPGNVLLDEVGEAYLADFGLTKQVGSASTETGRLVGTLDYLAPEQIRGEEIDGRTDEYALACVLFECLSGRAPFHRATEAELLWAHMQVQPPALAEHPSLDPIFQTALAKQKEDRYASSAEFVEAAATALGLETPRLRRRRRLLRRSRLLLAAGAVVLVGAVAALAVELTGGGSAEVAEAAANSVVAINPHTDRVETVVGIGRTPSAVAVGEGAVWVLNSDDKTVSKIDPQARRVEETFGVGGIPTDLAVGKGAVWVVSNGPLTGAGSLTVTRIDPGTGAQLDSLHPSLPSSPISTVGTYPQRQIAVGSSGVWLTEPLSGGLWRIDPRTNTVQARLTGLSPRSLASTARGVWLANPDSTLLAVTARGRTAQRVQLAATTLDDVAYGDGAIWALDRPDGTLWRIDPGPRPVSRTIPVGVGASSIAYGLGSVWVANGFDGTVLRVDPATNSVVKTIRVGGVPRTIAAGNGVVWVTVGGPGALRASACGPVVSGGEAKPDYLITSDFPLQSLGNIVPLSPRAIELVLRQHGFRAGRYSVGYQSCDDSIALTGDMDPYKCAANTRSFADDPRVIGMIGPLTSPCAKVEIPIANRASLPIISPSNSSPGLTRAGPGTEPGEPGKYYPTSVHTYFRVEESDAYQAAADAMLAKQLGVKKVFVLRLFEPHLVEDYPLAMAAHFEQVAKRLGLAVVGSSRWMDDRKKYRGLVARVARARPDAVFLGGWLSGNTGKLIEELRASLGRRAAIIAPDGFITNLDASPVFDAAGDAAIGMYVSQNAPPTSALPPAAQRFVQEFRRLHPETQIGDYPPWVPYTAQATEALLAAIARSDGTRSSVVRELHELRIVNGLLGNFRFDRYGDSTHNYTTILRVVKEPPPGSDTPHGVIDRVLSVPPGLVR